jgi:DNA-binding NtrC family response regulator
LEGDKNILLANLTDPFSKIIIDILDQWGYNVVLMEKPINLESISSSRRFNLIIYQFSEFSEREYQFLEAIKVRTGRSPIMATSNYISVRECFRMAKAGVQEYFGQPFQPLELKKLMENIASDGTSTECRLNSSFT